jgi:hypothetical protein
VRLVSLWFKQSGSNKTGGLFSATCTSGLSRIVLWVTPQSNNLFLILDAQFQGWQTTGQWINFDSWSGVPVPGVVPSVFAVVWACT